MKLTVIVASYFMFVISITATTAAPDLNVRTDVSPPGFTKLTPLKYGNDSRVFNYYISEGNATQQEANDNCAWLIFGQLATIVDKYQFDHVVEEVVQADAVGQHLWTAGQFLNSQWTWLTTGEVIAQDQLVWSSMGPCGASPETFNGLFLVTDMTKPATYCNNLNTLTYRYICQV